MRPLGVSGPGTGVTVHDLGFTGWGEYDLADYEYRPEEVLIRRHRIPGGRVEIVGRARALRTQVLRYSQAKLYAIVLHALTQFAADVSEMNERDAFFLICNVHDMMVAAAEGLGRSDEGVCVDALSSPFDQTVGAAPNAPYYGLVHRHEPTSLLAWAASAMSWADFAVLTARRDPPQLPPGKKAPTPPIDDFRDAVRRLRIGLGFTPSPRVTDEYTEDRARRSIAAGALALTKVIGLPTPTAAQEDLASASREMVAVMAAWLLDAFLRHGQIIGPGHLASSPSLYDIGMLRIGDVPWTEPRRARREARAERAHASST